ncbi:MAG: gliding motility-associated C-terminal domain-containing protein [Flavobacteriales bacterium]|nr:gliding motility-associated C-terminal domain-containing protein [Flavobacteriales bacterium]
MAATLRAFRTSVQATRSLLTNLVVAAMALVLSGTEAKATHAVGGELTYTCAGPNQYLATLKFYRDCNGVAAPTNCSNGRSFNVTSVNCGANFNLCFNLVSVQVITPICPTEVDRCVSATGVYGLEEYTFTRLIDLSAYAACGANSTDWVISWDLCCRNNAITSLQSPGNQTLYLNTALNNTVAPCNNSPVFLTNPTPFYCVGQQINYNPGAFDADGDSLAYSILQPRTTGNTNIPFAANYTLAQPIRNGGGAGAVQLNPITGTLTCIPNIQQVAVVTYRVREFRNGVQIGAVTRDVQIVVRVCSGNNSPTATGINGTSNYTTTVCAGTPVNFTINTADVNAGQNTAITWNGAIPGATFTTSGTPFQTGTFSWTPGVGDIGNNTFAVTVVDNACPLTGSNQYGYTVIVTPPFTPANAGPDLQSCGNVVLQALQPYGQTPGLWTVTSGSGTFSNATDPNTQVTGLAAGNNVFTWTLNYAPCGTTSDQVTVVNFDAGQQPAAAGPDQQLCLPTNSTTLAGNVANAPAIGTWNVVQGSGTFANANSPTTSVTGLTVGVNRFRWSVNNGPCNGVTQDDVTITVFSQLPVANAGPDQSICTPTTSVTMNASAATAPAAGTWTVVTGSGTFSNAASPTTQINGLTVGVHTFQWSVNNGACGSSNDQVTITVFNLASPNANAGADQQVCATTATLAGNTPIFPATGSWTLVSGSGNITAATLPGSGVTGLGVGANVFQWTLNNGPCANGLTSDQVTITRFDPAAPIANAGPDQSVCSSSPIATLAGNIPSAPSSGVWSVVSGTATITTPSSPTTTVTGLGVGTVTLRWTISNGPCGAPTSDVMVITVYDANAAFANAGADQNLCTPTSGTTLGGNIPTAPSTGSWVLVSGAGTITTPASPTSGVTALGVGVNVFRWTINNGACANPISTDDVTIVLSNNGLGGANAGADQNACSNAPNATLTATAASAPATGSWSLLSGSGTIANPSSNVTAISGAGVGSNVFQWTLANGACGTTNDQAIVFVFDVNNPVANAGPDQSLCSPASTTTMAGSGLIFPATGVWTRTSGTGTITTPGSPTTGITGLGIGTNVFRWTVNNGPCGAPTFDEVSIVVFNGSAASANAGTDQNLCSTTTTANMAASPAPAPATGQWSVISGGGTITAINSPFTTITNLPVGLNVFQWQVNNGPCGNTSDQVSIFVFDANNPIANAGPDQSQCTPFTTATMAGSNVIFPATGVWTLVSGSGTIVSPNSPVTSITGLGIGANTFQWTVSNGPCGPSTNDLVTISIFDQNAQPASAGADQSVCSTSPVVTVTGNAPVGTATGIWSITAGTGTITNPNSTTTTITGLGVGTVTAQWTINNGSCGTTFDQLNILVYNNANPVANAGADQNLCTPINSATLTGSNIIAPAIGTWTVIAGGGTITNVNLANTSVTELTVGLNTFAWTVNNGPCANGITTDQVSIFLFDANNPIANAGQDQFLCRPDTFTVMSGSSLIFPATGLWTLISGSGSITSPNSPTSAITGLGIGDNIFRWRVNNGPCGPVTSDLVLIRVYDNRQDDATAGPDQSICIPTFPNTVILTGNTPIAPATGQWTLVSGTGNIVSPTSPTTVVDNLIGGVATFQWTIDNGPCVNPITSDQVSVFVYDAANPIANAGTDQSLCTPVTSTVLDGSDLIAPATGTWSLISGSGTIVSPNDPNTQINGLGLGNNVFQWTVNNGPCVPGTTTDQVTINLFNGLGQPANAGPDLDLCSDVGTFNTSANSPTGLATGSWSVQQGSATFGSITDPTTTVTGLSVGVNILVWSIDNGACGISSDPVTIRVFDAGQSIANAGPDQEVCADNGPPQVLLDASGTIFPGQGQWTVTAGGGSVQDIFDPNTVAFNLGIGLNQFTWTVDNGPCSPGVTTDLVDVLVFDPNNPVADAGNGLILCTPATTGSLAGSSLIFPATGIWTVVQGTGVFSNATSPSTNVSALSVGVNTFQWTVSNGPCSNPITSDQVSITIYDANNPLANAGADQEVCTPLTSATLSGSNIISPATGTWTVVNGTGTFADANDPNTIVNGLSIGENQFVWTVFNGACANPLTTDQVSIFLFDQNNASANAGSDQDICGNTSTTLQGSAITFPATGLWTVSAGSGVFVNPTAPNTVVNNLGLGANTFTWTVSNGPCSTGAGNDAVTINVFDLNAAAANAGPDQQLCGSSSVVQLAANAPSGVSVGFWTVISGVASITDINDPNATVTGIPVGETILSWTLDNGPCGTSSDQVSIQIFDDQQADANAGADQDLCLPTNTATLSGSAYSFPSTGVWTLVIGSGDITDATLANTTVNNLAIGENVFQWTVDNGPCGGVTTDLVSISIYDNAAASADAGPDQELCTPVSSATLSANTPVGVAVGTWTLLQGTGSFADANDPNTTITGISVGETRCQWTINNGPCGNSSDVMSIFLFDATNPIANAGPDQELCTPTTSAVLSGSTIIFPAQGTWSVVQGTGSFADANDPNSAVSGLTVGENIFEWTVDNGPCANGITTDQVSIFLFNDANADANAGPDQELCTPLSTTTLAGSAVIFPAQGTWTLANGTGVFTDANDPATDVSGLTIGENIFVWTVSNGPCANGNTVDSVSVFVFDENNPVSNAGPDQELCSPASTTTLTGSAVTFPASGTWSLVQGTGVFANANDPNTSVSGLTVGENIFQWDVSNGPCSNPLTTDQVSIFVYSENNLDADAGADQELCTPAESTTLTGSALIFPASGVWTLVSGSGLITDTTDPGSTVTGLAVGANVFAWTVDNGPCANGTTTDEVTIFIFDVNNPGANAGPDQEICTPTSTTTMAGSSVVFPAVGTWTLVNGTGVIADVNDPNTSISGLTIGENIFEWTVDNGPCANGVTVDQVSIFVFDENNLVANAGPDQELCTPTSDAVLNGSAITFPATGTWSLISGTGSIVNVNDPNTTVNGLVVGENIFVWTVDNGPCLNGLTTDTVSIFLFDAANELADAGADQELCTPTTSAQLSGSPVIFPAIGTWTIQGAGVFADANDPNTTVSGLAVGQTILTWTVDNGPCESGISDDDLTILVYDENNLVADAGADQELCTPNTSTNFAGSAIIFPAVGTWTLVQGTGDIADINDPNSAVSNLSVGENSFAWTVTNGPCANPVTTDVMSIFVFSDENPDADAGADQQICTPVTSATLSGSAITFPASGLWTILNGTGTITDPTDPNTTVTNIGIGTLDLVWTVSNGPCANGITTDQVTIELFDLNSPPAAAGPDQEQCTPNTSTVLAGNNPTAPGSGVWSVFQGAANFTDATSPTTAVDGLPVGENILVWTLENGVCGISRDSVSIFIFDEFNLPANAGPDVEICTPQDSIFLAGNTPTFPASGTWTLVEGAGLFADVNDPNSKVVGLTIGTNTFAWTTSNGPCPNAITSDTMTVILYSDSTNAPNAGPDLETCIPLTFVQMQAETPLLPATGSWSVVGGVGTVVDPTDPTSVVNGLAVGITTLVWTLDLGPCPNNGLLTDTVDIYIYDPTAPVADAGPDQELCTPDTFTVTQALVPSFPGEGTWTLITGTGDIADIHDPATAITGLTIGINTFDWLVYNGQCGFGPPTHDTLTIAVFDSTAAPAAAGPDQQLCTPNTNATMAGNSATFPGTGNWTIVSGGGTVTNANDPLTVIANIPVGENIFVWTIDNGACGTTTDTLTVEVFDNTAPAANAGPDLSLCLPTQPNTINMAGSVPVFPGAGSWTLVSGTGTITDPTSPTTSITDLDIGVSVFAWSISNGPCGNTSDEVTITIYNAASPDANAGADQELCASSSTTLTGNAPIFPATGVWSILSGSGVLSDATSPSSSITGLVTGETVLVWTLSNGPCANGITSDTVTVQVFDGTAGNADAGDDQNLCEPGTATVNMSASTPSFPAVGVWQLVSGTGTIVNANDPNTTISDIGFGTSVFSWSIDNGACGTSSDEVEVAVFDANELPADAGPDQAFCQDTTQTQMAAVELVSGTATASWVLLSGTGNINTATDPATIVDQLVVGSNIFLWSVSNGACGNTADSCVITVNDCTELTIPDAFSPNGDGVNDTYVIEGLEFYPENTLQVFNRWGSIVLDRNPYNNNWDGRSENSLNWGEDLPESTYYYILDLGNDKEAYTGYIYLKR